MSSTGSRRAHCGRRSRFPRRPRSIGADARLCGRGSCRSPCCPYKFNRLQCRLLEAAERTVDAGQDSPDGPDRSVRTPDYAGEGLVGLLVAPTNLTVCNVVYWKPQSALWTPVKIPQTAPIDRCGRQTMRARVLSVSLLPLQI